MSQLGKKDDSELLNIDHSFVLKKNNSELSHQTEDTMKLGNDVAIIGFWKQNER